MAHKYKVHGKIKWRGEVKTTIDDKVIRRTKVWDTKRQAEDWEAEQRKEFKELRQGEVISEEETLFYAANDYLDYAQDRFHKSTFLNKRKVLRDFFRYLLEKEGINPPVVPVRHLHINPLPRIIKDFILSKKTSTQKNRTRKELHAFCEYCRTFFGLEKNPGAYIKREDEERKPQRVATEEEVAKLLLAADRHDRNMIVTYCVTGVRKSELFRMTWEDINFEKGYVTVKHRKGTGVWRERQLPMDRVLHQVLEDQWKTKLPHSNYVFQNRAVWKDKDGNVVRKHPNYGQRYTARRKFLSGLCKRAGIPRMGFHALRRFFSSVAIDKHKVALPSLQKLLGHEQLTTTQKYVFAITSDQLEAVAQIGETMEQLLNGGSSKGEKEQKVEGQS
jgi:integrase